MNFSGLWDHYEEYHESLAEKSEVANSAVDVETKTEDEHEDGTSSTPSKNNVTIPLESPSRPGDD